MNAWELSVKLLSNIAILHIRSTGVIGDYCFVFGLEGILGRNLVFREDLGVLGMVIVAFLDVEALFPLVFCQGLETGTPGAVFLLR